MDIQNQVAARRAQLAREAKEARVHEQAAAAEKSRRQREQRIGALDDLAAELSANRTQVARTGEILAIVEEPLAALDPADFRRKSLEDMLKREARRRWTTQQNWAAIGFITAGLLLLIPAFPVGALLIVLGIAFGHSFNRRHRADLIRDFPNLFGAFAPAQEPGANK